MSKRTNTTNQTRERAIRRVQLWVLVLNLLVAGAKIVYGLISGSLAITADGFHSTLDGMSNVVALAGLWVAARPPDPNHAYGHHRYETLATLGIAAIMMLALFGLLQGAWGRLQSGTAPTITAAAFVIMLSTLAINVFVTLWERRAAKRYDSDLLMADARHTTSDILTSLSVIASLVLVRMGFGWADAGITFVIAIAIAWAAWNIVKEASLVLTDATVAEASRIERVVRAVPGVRGTHNIRTRGAGGRVWVDLHIQVDPELQVPEAHDIASEVARSVEDDLGERSDVTVHVEPADEQHLREERGHEVK